MNKIKSLLQYLLIGTICSNFPWLVLGMAFGFPAVILSAIILTKLDKYMVDRSFWELLLLNLFVSHFSSFVWFLALSWHKKENELLMMYLAEPAMILASIVSSALRYAQFKNHYKNILIRKLENRLNRQKNEK